MAASWRGLFGGLKGAKDGRMNGQRVCVGTDLAGNSYFEIAPTAAGSRVRRVVDMKTPTRHGADYDPEVVPPEWQSWLRHRRTDPPTLDELRTSLQRQAAVRARAVHAEQVHEQAKLDMQVDAVRLQAAAVANAAAAVAGAADEPIPAAPGTARPADGETGRRER